MIIVYQNLLLKNMTIAEANLQIEGLKEIMFVNCEIEKDLFMSMSNDEIREFVDEKLLEESVRVFLLDEENLNIPSEENINISAAFTDDYQNPPVEEDKIRLIFCTISSAFSLRKDSNLGLISLPK